MELYFHPISSNSRRVTATLLQLDMSVELIVIDLLNGDHKDARYLRLNPNGKVPLLVDGEFRLWESHAIMQYLAEICPGQTLYPRDARARADVSRWLFWSAYHFTPAVGAISRERVSKRMLGGSGNPDLAAIERGEAALTEAAGLLDAHLARRSWIAQRRLTLADLAIAAPLMHTDAAQLPVLGFRHLQAWFRRVQTLDAWRNSEPGRIGGRPWRDPASR